MYGQTMVLFVRSRYPPKTVNFVKAVDLLTKYKQPASMHPSVQHCMRCMNNTANNTVGQMRARAAPCMAHAGAYGDEAPRVRHASLAGELSPVNNVAAVRGKLDAVNGLEVFRARLCKLAGDAADFDDGYAAAELQHDGHLEEHAVEVADAVGSEVVEGLSAVAPCMLWKQVKARPG